MTTNTIKNTQDVPESSIQSLVEGINPDVLTSVYQKHTNIVTWKRNLPSEITTAVDEFLKHNKTKATNLSVTPENISEILSDTFGNLDTIAPLKEDIALLVDMFCCLFELKEAGLRITILERAMCPRFHFDRIPCRMVTTYRGAATQWLNNEVIDRSKLGAGNLGKTDEDSGLFNSLNDINQVSQGDVVLLKGEHWFENEGAGLVHRSPPVTEGERRLLLTLDFLPDWS